ncbi:YhgE/Pip domain-containing protein [Cytobacillus horneckiae]|uniref:ABC-2 type transporter transmembrane domain-containing protein n=1 Tax=Cytobacillus horneckiae TaxID=549687 RepID=A0A2N0ZAJ9_9BACI|nr:ABC transporter permease [Cytobacillus horneckiae]MEC1158933.1 hypothetical protein [Cytobacillus horneckiae]PKG26532.1 hypothetical protein CWS20_23500 [Cytobacillus horneckiae]
MRNFFFNKFFWLGLIMLMVVVGIFMVGFLASVVNPIPKDLPVALVVEDEGVVIEETTFNLGESIQESLREQEDLPIRWIEIEDRSVAMNRLAEGDYYGILYIPKETSQNVLSLLQPNSKKPVIEVVLNEGSQYIAANTTNQIINNKVITEIVKDIQLKFVKELDGKEIVLNTEQLSALLNPLNVDQEVINEVGTNTANGNLPVLLTQILWLSIFIGSVILFMVLKKTYNGQKNVKSLISQIFGGLIFVVTIVTTMLLIAKGIFDVDITEIKTSFLFLIFAGLVFFFLQNALFNWIGLIASPIILLVFLFSIPILNFPTEYLPSLTNTLLYSWIPLRFSVEGLREVFFFDEVSLTSTILTLTWIGISGLIIMSLSLLRKKVKNKQTKETQVRVNNFE